MEGIPTKIELHPNAWKEVGYRRTFTLVFQLMSGTVPANANEINFHAVFTTSGTKSYEAWHKDGTLRNCTIDDDGKVRVTFVRHNLEVGEMYCEVSMMWRDTTATVPDVFRFATGVKLVSSGGTDPSELNIDLQLPYVNVGLNWEDVNPKFAALVTKNDELGERIDEVSKDLESEKESLNKKIEALGARDEVLGIGLDEVSKELESEKEVREENIETLNDTFRNLATINGRSLLDGGDIVIAGDGTIDNSEFIWTEVH